MTWQTWSLYALAAIGLSLTPGPNGLLALTHGALHGTKKTLATIAGGSLGFGLIIGLSMFGIGALLGDLGGPVGDHEVARWSVFGVAGHSSDQVRTNRHFTVQKCWQWKA